MKIGSLFTGYGGLDLAAEQFFNAKTVWYSEIEPAAVKILAEHYPDIPNLGDITVIDWATVPRVDVLIGGYPCQPFSQAGKREGANDERHLWPFVKTAIDALRPTYVVLENVRGHLSLGFGDVLSDLSRLGYSARWGLVRASDVGACHQRARIFIVAYPNGSGRDENVKQPGDVSPAENERQSGKSDRYRSDRDVAAKVFSSDSESAEWRVKESEYFGASVGSTAESRECVSAAADSHSRGHGQQLHTGGMGGVQVEVWSRDKSESGSVIDWGKYEPAIRRWESITRLAPDPTVAGFNGRPRLSPHFVEWMMGLSEGRVTGRGLSVAKELKILGNGVVPQQALLALRLLLGTE